MSVRSPVTALPRTRGYELPGVGLDVRGERASSRRGLVAIVGLLVSGLLIAVAAAHTETMLPESVRPVPASLAGAFNGAGLNLHVGGTIAALILMFVSYAVVVSAAGQLSGRVVLAAVAALFAVVLLAPPLFSTDIFSYQAYARMGTLYGINPYTHGPYAIAPDAVYPYIGAKWVHYASAYGPVFTVFSYALAPLSIASSVFAYKSIAAVAGIALVALVWHCARLRGKNPVTATALVGLNPLLLIYGVGGGHNDLLMLVALVGGLYAILASRERLGSGLTMVAVGVKLTAGLVLPFALAAAGPRGGRGRRDLAMGALIGVALIGALSFALFGTGSFNMLATVNKTQTAGDWLSIPGFITSRLGLATAGHIAGYLLAAGFLAVCGWLLRRVWRGQTDWIDGAGWAMLAMLGASSSLLPWYVAWLLPLAALGHDRRLHRLSIVLTGVVLGIALLGYIPHGSVVL
ncbi:MAG: polyprenol phosphomannose-dependent alpha 1,6 mannosyltransferase MptB [Solirubrobacteraceae bacterium]